MYKVVPLAEQVGGLIHNDSGVQFKIFEHLTELMDVAVKTELNPAKVMLWPT